MYISAGFPWQKQKQSNGYWAGMTAGKIPKYRKRWIICWITTNVCVRRHFFLMKEKRTTQENRQISGLPLTIRFSSGRRIFRWRQMCMENLFCRRRRCLWKSNVPEGFPCGWYTYFHGSIFTKHPSQNTEPDIRI